MKPSEHIEMRTVYCDEAGYTGNRLMDESQPHFAFAAIELPPSEAEAYVSTLCRANKISAIELKGGRLCKQQRGQALIRQVIEEYADNASVIVFDKKFALAGKMFEYLIEPAVSPVSSLLYDLGFHQFVANSLYCHMVVEGSTGESVYERFEIALRQRTQSKLIEIDSSIKKLNVDGFVDQVIAFLICNRDKIADEVVHLEPGRAGGWMLELSTTALGSLLAIHGRDMQPMEVFCDDSKPLADQIMFFNGMVGRTDRQTVVFAGREHQMTYNLARPIQLVSSSAMSGIQLADVFASASVFALKNKEHPLSKFWFSQCEKFLDNHSVVPDMDYVDFSKPKTIANCMLFHEIFDLSIRGEDYCAAIPAITHRLRTILHTNPTSLLISTSGKAG
jgi:hypothetical protein